MSGHQYIPRPVATVLPNVLGFTYNGVRYEIFIDVGEHDEAYQLAADEDWEALSKWPKYSMFSCAFHILHLHVLT